jgi:hypothetical protein
MPPASLLLYEGLTMRRIAVLLTILLGAPLLGAADETKLTFSKVDANKLPRGWKAEQTNEGKDSSIWKVVPDKTAPSKSGYVLYQSAKSRSQVFNLCVAQDTKFKDGEISVHFKPIAGKVDQGGGIAWRYQDASNYYVCRYNPLEDNFRVYKVVKGKRIELGRKEELTLPSGRWYTLSIRHDGDRIECSLEGKKHLEVKDDTIKEAGRVALWSKADAQTSFDVLTIKGK